MFPTDVAPTHRATLIEIVRCQLDAKLLQNAIGVQTPGWVSNGGTSQNQKTLEKKTDDVKDHCSICQAF